MIFRKRARNVRCNASSELSVVLGAVIPGVSCFFCGAIIWGRRELSRHPISILYVA